MEAPILIFNSRSRGNAKVSNHLEKIVMIGENSPIKQDDVQEGVPYFCEFEVYDTNPANPFKGARIVNVVQPVIVERITMTRVKGAVDVVLIGSGMEKEITIPDDAFDVRRDIRDAMRSMQCHINYEKIDKISAHVLRKREEK